jgi:carbon storage regulator
MLVITRREGESIFIGDEIEIVILETGSAVRVGINAPPEVNVVRTELIPPEELELVD